jgi:hypothetical protein
MQTCDECGKDIKLRNTGGARWRVACECPDLSTHVPRTRATIIVPSKHNNIFEACKNSIDKYAPKEKKILVRDGNAIPSPDQWITVQGPASPFVYSRNINLGIKQSTGDVLLTNDDVRFTHPYTLEIMQNVMEKNPDVGILSPLIIGDVGEFFQSHATKTLHYTQVRLCFVCVLIKREVLDKVGLLDERFTGYGYDDCDYSRRVVEAGWKLGVTAKAKVIHGHGDNRRSASYNRQEYGTINALDEIAKQQYLEKWGDLSLECK